VSARSPICAADHDLTTPYAAMRTTTGARGDCRFVGSKRLWGLTGTRRGGNVSCGNGSLVWCDPAGGYVGTVTGPNVALAWRRALGAVPHGQSGHHLDATPGSAEYDQCA
jgi:hypothetical protein